MNKLLHNNLLEIIQSVQDVLNDCINKLDTSYNDIVEIHAIGFGQAEQQDEKQSAPQPAEHYPLTLTSKDQFSTFKDGFGVEWDILDFFKNKDYEIIAYTKEDDLYADFNQFGKRRHYKQDSDHSLKSIA